MKSSLVFRNRHLGRISWIKLKKEVMDHTFYEKIFRTNILRPYNFSQKYREKFLINHLVQHSFCTKFSKVNWRWTELYLSCILSNLLYLRRQMLERLDNKRFPFFQCGTFSVLTYVNTKPQFVLGVSYQDWDQCWPVVPSGAAACWGWLDLQSSAEQSSAPEHSERKTRGSAATEGRKQGGGEKKTKNKTVSKCLGRLH